MNGCDIKLAGLAVAILNRSGQNGKAVKNSTCAGLITVIALALIMPPAYAEVKLAGLFEKACDRTQIILATHASYFLTQFDISRIAVMRKEDGQAVFAKPGSSRALAECLKDFGAEEIEVLHRSDELERLA